MTVFDQSYQRWTGEFKTKRLRWLPMVRYQVALTLKRKFIWLILFIAIVPSLLFCGVIYFSGEIFPRMSDFSAPMAVLNPQEEAVSPIIDTVVGEIGQMRQTEWPGEMTRADKYWIATTYGFYFFLMVPQSFVVLLVTSAVGSGLIAQDLRSNALEIYLTKPITAVDYIMGKMAVITVFILITTFLPSVLVFATASMTMQGYFDVAWPIIPRLFAACMLASLVNGVFMLGLSSLAKSARYATVIWFTLCLISSIASLVLTEVTRNSSWLFIGYRNNFSYLVSELLGGDLMFDLTSGEPIGVSPIFPVLILSSVVLLSIFIMRKTIRSVENR